MNSTIAPPLHQLPWLSRMVAAGVAVSGGAAPAPRSTAPGIASPRSLVPDMTQTWACSAPCS